MLKGELSALTPAGLVAGLNVGLNFALKLGLAVGLTVGLAVGPMQFAAARVPDLPAGTAPVALAALPAEAQTTHQRILQGGPFPYDKDASVFGNRERLLPLRPRGHYREYTVKTAGAKNRGARRIVCGGTPPTRPEVCFYTADHYASFNRILP